MLCRFDYFQTFDQDSFRRYTSKIRDKDMLQIRSSSDRKVSRCLNESTDYSLSRFFQCSVHFVCPSANWSENIKTLSLSIGSCFYCIYYFFTVHKDERTMLFNVDSGFGSFRGCMKIFLRTNTDMQCKLFKLIVYRRRDTSKWLCVFNMLKHDAYVFYCIYKVIYWERARAPMYYARRVYVHALWLFECRNMENRNINEAQDVVSSHFVSLYQIFVIFDCTFLIHNATAAAATSVFRIVCSFLCAAHTHSVLAFVFLSFCFLISFDAVVVVVVSFILCPFVAACNLLVAFTYRALLFLFKLLENLPEYKYSHSLPHPSASSKYTGYVYRSILQHPNRTRTNRTTLRELCVCVWASICIIVVRILLLLLSVVVVMFLLS